jgi:hypothetical protein
MLDLHSGQTAAGSPDISGIDEGESHIRGFCYYKN